MADDNGGDTTTSEDNPVPPLGQPRYRWDDLDGASVYERMGAAPSSDDELQLMWIFSGIMTTLVALTTMVVFLGIATNKKVRSKPFNMYLLYLTLPDFLFSGFCVFTCFLSTAQQQFFSSEMCTFQAVYLVFGFAANGWINGLIAWEIHRLLRSSNMLLRYHPPTHRQVNTKVAIIYAYSVVVGTMSLYSGDLLQPGLYAGYFCFAKPTNRAGDFFYFLVFMPLMVFIPYNYVFWVVFDVLFRSKLLPPRGKRRDLSIFFFRIAFVFLVMWFPVIIIDMILRGRTSPWVAWAAGTWAHTQGIISALIACMKPDVGAAVKQLLCCSYMGKRQYNEAAPSSVFGFFIAKWKRRRGRDRSNSSTSRNNLPSGLATGAEPADIQAVIEEDDIPEQGNDFQFSDETVPPAVSEPADESIAAEVPETTSKHREKGEEDKVESGASKDNTSEEAESKTRKH